MEDLYKDDPNSWMRRTRFSKTVYKRLDASQISFISINELKFGYSNPKSNRTGAVTSVPVTCDSTSRTSQCTTMSSLKSNPDTGSTVEVQDCKGSPVPKDKQNQNSIQS